MTVSYYTHVRCLGDGSYERPYQYSLEFLPEIDALLMFIAHNAACVGFDQKPISANVGRERWSNTSMVARNKHIAIIYTSLDDDEFNQQLNIFNIDRPAQPYAFDFSEYVNNVLNHRSLLINQLKSFDASFDESQIISYINNIIFNDVEYQDVQLWMNELLNNNNIIYPNLLCENNLWVFAGLNNLYNKWKQESINSDINKMFKAFEIYNMDCILEVI